MKTLPHNSLSSRCIITASILFLFTILSSFAQEEFLSEESLFEEDLDEVATINDPLESVNRVFFRFNDYVYTYVATPVSDIYELAPASARKGVGNFFNNLRYPVRLAGNILQGRTDGAWLETRRFAVNSTVGLLGVLDLASEVEGLEKIEKEDMGQALGSWGLGEGPYLVLPFFGPSNLRDLVGMLGDRTVNPWIEPFSVLDSEARMVYSVGNGVSSLPVVLELYDQMKGTAIDPYSSLKNAFTQYRRSAVER
jgi:phospholipid-binding lipoprotein MlaA